MLSTSHTLLCPTCGQQAMISLFTVRHRKAAQRDAFEPNVSFSCRNRCTLAMDVVRTLCGLDAVPA